ncbi:ribonuclease HII [Salimicrobium sp. PL1-032A]|uniref:ribonuclease HII n=1 Tax=Salimicrobium sp. PL1-032A TaxID=3095364 RepID=UPI003261A3FB
MEKKSIKQLKEEEKKGSLVLADIQEDDRKGVQQIAARMKKRQAQQQHLENKWQEMNRIETEKKSEGYTYIAGIDEAGRGPIAGPVTAACVRLPEQVSLYGLDDSKKLSEKDKEFFYDEIMAHADVGIGEASAEEIDDINIYQATKLAMKRAVENMEGTADFLLVDAMSVPVSSDQKAYVKGDERSVSIAAASVIAKVTRDRFMINLGKLYPGYGFESNKGYGTKSHLEAIKADGVTPYHRMSFVPVRSR